MYVVVCFSCTYERYVVVNRSELDQFSCENVGKRMLENGRDGIVIMISCAYLKKCSVAKV